MSGKRDVMDRNKNKKKRIEFSKVMVITAFVMWITVNVFGMVMVALTLDLSPIIYIISSVDAVAAVVAAFYSWKAKAENQIKLRRIYGDIAKEATQMSSGQYESWDRNNGGLNHEYRD